jgi:UPF0716 family protein affecting phage T7 exclusion
MPLSVRFLEKIKSDVARIARDEPGRRFTAHHQRHRQRESRRAAAWKTAGYVIAGVLLIAAGLILSIPPGVPGFLLWIPGIGLLAARFRALAAGLDRAELFLRRIVGKR